MDVHTVNEETWAFDLGQRVTHRDQPFPSVVMARVRTSKGHEIYGIRRNEECEVRDLMVLGEVLVAA
jgi:hypothetical protein